MAENLNMLRKLRKLTSVTIVILLPTWDSRFLQGLLIELFINRIAYIFPILKGMLGTGCSMVAILGGSERVQLKAEDLNEAW